MPTAAAPAAAALLSLGCFQRRNHAPVLRMHCLGPLWPCAHAPVTPRLPLCGLGRWREPPKAQTTGRASTWAALCSCPGPAAPTAPATARQERCWHLRRCVEGVGRAVDAGVVVVPVDCPPQAYSASADLARLASCVSHSLFIAGVSHLPGHGCCRAGATCAAHPAPVHVATPEPAPPPSSPAHVQLEDGLVRVLTRWFELWEDVVAPPPGGQAATGACRKEGTKGPVLRVVRASAQCPAARRALLQHGVSVGCA